MGYIYIPYQHAYFEAPAKPQKDSLIRKAIEDYIRYSTEKRLSVDYLDYLSTYLPTYLSTYNFAMERAKKEEKKKKK